MSMCRFWRLGLRPAPSTRADRSAASASSGAISSTRCQASPARLRLLLRLRPGTRQAAGDMPGQFAGQAPGHHRRRRVGQRRAALRKRYGRATDKTERDSLLAELELVAQEDRDDAPPPVPQLWTSNATPEALTSSLAEHRRMAVVTQYKSHSLLRHMQRGWSFFRAELNEMVDLLPAQQRVGEEHWYRGTADCVYQNLDYVRQHHPQHVLVLAGLAVMAYLSSKK